MSAGEGWGFPGRVGRPRAGGETGGGGGGRRGGWGGGGGPRGGGGGGEAGARWREEVVTIGVEEIAPVLDLGGANRSRGGRPRVPEKSRLEGRSWRKLPGQESLRLRNSSGSVTA